MTMIRDQLAHIPPRDFNGQRVFLLFALEFIRRVQDIPSHLVEQINPRNRRITTRPFMLSLQNHAICFDWFKDKIPRLPKHLVVCERGDYRDMVVKLAMVAYVYMHQLSNRPNLDLIRECAML